MDFIGYIRDKSAERPRTVVLPEADDPRMIHAAKELTSGKLVKKVVFVGDEDDITAKCAEVSMDMSMVDIRDHAKDPEFAELCTRFFEKRKHKGITEEDARETIKNPLYYAAMLLDMGKADAVVAGALNTTGNVLRAAIQGVGLKAGMKTVSSVFIMVTQREEFGHNGILLFGDCAVVPDPDSGQMADIAEASAATAKNILGIEPKVAMMSFSTKGSAKHERVDKVCEAVEILGKRGVSFEFDGEMQADAAIVESVAAKKAPGSTTAGHANCLIFPSLEAGNIGYKLVQRLAGAEAIGPVIQGLAKPYNDLSRGCSVEDIVNTVCLTLLNA